MSEVRYKTFDVCDARRSGDLWSELCVDLILTAPPFYVPDQYDSADAWVDLIASSLLSAAQTLKPDGALVVLLGEDGHAGHTRRAIGRLIDQGFWPYREDVWAHNGNMGADEWDSLFYLSRDNRKYMPRRFFRCDAPHPARVRFKGEGRSWGVSWFGVMAPALAETVIREQTKEGDLVLDPFCGSGVTVHAAAELGRVGYGSDIIPETVEYARNNDRA